MVLEQFKRKEGPTVLHLFCFLTGIFLGNWERVKLRLWVSLVYCFTSERWPCFEFVLVLDLFQDAALLSNYAIFKRGCVYKEGDVPKVINTEVKNSNNQSERGKEDKCSVLLKGDILKTRWQKDRSSARETPTGKSHREGQYKPSS